MEEGENNLYDEELEVQKKTSDIDENEIMVQGDYEDID